MRSNQKGFSNTLILGIIAAVVLIGAGIGGYFVFVKKYQQQQIQDGETLVPDDLKQLILRDMAVPSKSGGPIITDKFTPYAADLNSDGVNEYIITPDPQYFAGASGNTTFFIYQKTANAWGNIGAIYGNQYQILNTETKGYKNLQTRLHESADAYSIRIYEWDDMSRVYREFKKQLIEQNDTSTWQTYRNEKYGFEVRYPSDFEISYSNFNESIPTMSLHLTPRDNSKKDWISIGIIKTDKMSYRESIFEPAKNKTITDIDLDGVNGKKIQQVTESPPDILPYNPYWKTGVMYYIEKEVFSYSIIYYHYGTPVDSVNIVPFNQILSTFKFVEPVEK